jgi:hypothetical protein
MADHAHTVSQSVCRPVGCDPVLLPRAAEAMRLSRPVLQSAVGYEGLVRGFTYQTALPTLRSGLATTTAVCPELRREALLDH